MSKKSWTNIFNNGFDLSAEIADRLLKNPDFSANFEESKRIHMRTFGELLEPAFSNDSAAEIELVGALNYINRGEYDRAMRKLARLKKRCRTLWDGYVRSFFMGLCCERAGMSAPAIEYLSDAEAANFYMTNVLLARLLHKQRKYDAALTEYLIGIHGISERKPRNEIPAVNFDELTGALYAGAADCSLMMGNYADAEWALIEAGEYGLESKQLYIIYAMLYAVTERKSLALKKLSELKKLDPELEASVAFDVAEAMAGKNPRFSLRTDILKKLDYDGFWSWFAKREERFLTLLRYGMVIPVASEISIRLTELFEFAKTLVAVSIAKDKDGFLIMIADDYILSLSDGLDRLSRNMPESLGERWSVKVVN